MKKILALIDNFEEAETVTDYAIRLANDSNKELEVIHFILQGRFRLSRIANGQISLPLKMIQKTDALVEKRLRILAKIISVKQASVDLPFPLKYSVKQMPLYLIIRYLNKRNDFDTVIISDSNSCILSEFVDNLKHPLFIYNANND